MKQRELVKKIIPKEQLKRIKNNQCPVCSLPKSKWTRRTDWRCCSIECTEEFWKTYISYGWQDIRIKVFKRDNFTCVECGKHSTASELIGDHIIPIALGGDEWDLKNIQTLCIKCNKKKTKKDAKNIAKQRRIEKKLIKGQRQIK